MPVHAPSPSTARTAPPDPIAHAAAGLDFWPLDPAYTFLNHGSFGSLPHVLRARQDAFRMEVERHPIEVLGRQCRERLTRVRDEVAGFIGVDAPGLGLVTNATEGINAVLRSLDLKPGDVLVTTDHVYNAVLQTMRYVARRAGAEVRVVAIPTPVRSPKEVLAAVSAAIDARTRLVLVDHVTSPTAVVLPAAEIGAECARRGVEFLCDGAHAPSMLELDVSALQATYYAGNLHKWTCAPKGCGFLWANDATRARIHPATVSHFLDQGFDAEFDWQGTRDISAWLTVPDAIALWRSIGAADVRRHNRDLARWVGRLLRDRWQTEPIVELDGPEAEPLLGSMVAVTLPDAVRRRFETPEALQAALYATHRTEIPVIAWAGRWHCRASCQVYNRPEDYERLAEAVPALAR
jgi:isopenicillin-N epimerase